MKSFALYVNGYFRKYNAEHPERLVRIGIDLETCGYNSVMYLGDPEWESLAQITLVPDCEEIAW